MVFEGIKILKRVSFLNTINISNKFRREAETLR